MSRIARDRRMVLDAVGRHRGVLQKRRDRVSELLQTFFAGGDDPDHGAAELCGERLEVDLDSLLARDVEHVDDHEHREAHFDQLRREVEVSFQIRGVDDVDDGLGFAGEKIVARDAFVFPRGGAGGGGVDPGKVDQCVLDPLVREVPDLLVDGDAGPVADLLVRAGQGVEERGFAAVRVPDAADGPVGHRRKLGK